MKFRPACLALALAAFAASMPLHAQSKFKVGRATVLLPEGDWRELERKNVAAVTVEDKRGNLMAERVTLAWVAGTDARMVLVVIASAGGLGRYVEWRSTCPDATADYWFDRLSGGSPTDLACLGTSKPAPLNALANRQHDLNALLASAGLRFEDEAVRMEAKVGGWTGMFAHALAFAPAQFAGLPATEGEEPMPPLLPIAVSTSHARFARQLGNRVRESVYAMRAQMDLTDLLVASAAAPSTTKQP